MFEELLENQENLGSILIVDSFENDSTALLCLLIQKISQTSQNVQINLYPTDQRSQKQFCRFEPRATVKRTLLDSLLIDFQKQIFKEILNELTNNDSTPARNLLVFENINLIIRHLNGNPFELIQFLLSLRTIRNISGVFMVVHEDSTDNALVSQLGRIFQTVIRINDTKVNVSEINRFADINKNLLKYNLEIDKRSIRNSKIITHEETVFLTSDLEVVRIEKNLKKKEESATEINKDDQDDLLKGLTFNVHLSSDDLEAKRNLILPYEILGKTQPEPKESRFEEAKIYYAPDERDDVDDDDPDDDLNF